MDELRRIDLNLLLTLHALLTEKHVTRAAQRLHRDCQDFRVWAGIMGKKESHYVPTQRTGDTG